MNLKSVRFRDMRCSLMKIEKALSLSAENLGHFLLLPRVGFIVTNVSAKAEGAVRFYNGRGSAEQWIKEGKYALNWTRLSCKTKG